MELGLRLRLICDDPGAWLPRVNAGLRAHGLLAADGAHPEPASARPATLLFFDDLSPQVLNAVGETSRAGRDRTLAVATCRRALGDGGVWSLLRRGASDAFAWDDVDDPIAQVAARLERWGRIDSLIETPAVRNHLIGTSPSLVGLPTTDCRAVGVLRRAGAPAGRERDRQGAAGAAGARARPAVRPARSGRARLHDGRARALGQRILRTRARRIHRRGDGARRCVRARRRRHALSRRGR